MSQVQRRASFVAPLRAWSFWLLLLPILLTVAGLTSTRAASPAVVARLAASHAATTAAAAPMTVSPNIPQHASTRRPGPRTTAVRAGGSPLGDALTAQVVIAAEGLSALERGASRVPSSWGPGLANKKGVGTRWTDPANQGNGIRIDQGIPGSGWPSQQVDHVVVRSGGKILGPDGKPIVGSLAENPQAHIPLSDWLKWADWNLPG